MRQIGEQWVVEINGQKHMVKVVKQPEGGSHISGKIHPCFKCIFQMDDYDCEYPRGDWKFDIAKNCIIKDLGILMEGKLPSSFGVYPTTVPPSEVEELWLLYSWVKNDGIVAKKEMAYGRTEQEAIDNWNRRSL